MIVAVPPELSRAIQWGPDLPARHRALLDHMNMGDLMKCDAVYEEPFWRADGLNGFGISDHGAVRAAFDNCPADGMPGVLLAFVGGSTWKQYGLTTLAARRAAVLQGFAEMFGEKALHPIEYVEHDWTKERWTKGSPVAIMAPGTLTTWGQELRRPHLRTHWAGTETSSYWTGYMDGAVRAGKRAVRRGARLALTTLGSGDCTGPSPVEPRGHPSAGGVHGPIERRLASVDYNSAFQRSRRQPRVVGRVVRSLRRGDMPCRSTLPARPRWSPALTQGIGLAIAAGLAAAGARVGVNGRSHGVRSAEPSPSWARSCRRPTSSPVAGRRRHRGRRRAGARSRCPDVDVLVNNLGIFECARRWRSATTSGAATSRSTCWPPCG